MLENSSLAFVRFVELGKQLDWWQDAAAREMRTKVLYYVRGHPPTESLKFKLIGHAPLCTRVRESQLSLRKVSDMSRAPLF